MATPTKHNTLLLFVLLIAAAVNTTLADDCGYITTGACYDKDKSTNLKIIAIFAILVSSMIGVGSPLLTRTITFLQPDREPFVLIKSFASGVVLATGFMHVLPDSWNDLTSECLSERPWRVFPVTTFIAMVSAVGTMVMDTVATAYYRKRGEGVSEVVKLSSVVHNHGSHGTLGDAHVHDDDGEVETGGGGRGGGGGSVETDRARLLRHRIVAQVLELGIVVHSVVIGLSMGVSNNPCTIRPLIAAMCFHQLFEGMGLGGCILQAEYGLKTKAIMVGVFSLTTPFGIALGLGLMKVYNQNSTTALIVVGVLNAVSSGLLIYMALVDLLAAEFTGPKLQNSIRLQLWAYVTCLFGLWRHVCHG
ncbi:hypothetical protein Droror1_Dr00002770 [Drosera rotundifolia]